MAERPSTSIASWPCSTGTESTSWSSVAWPHRSRCDPSDVRPRLRPIAGPVRTSTGSPLDDVIASKEWADRPKDREPLPELRALKPHGN